MAKERISRAEYLQLLGLGLIANQHYAKIKDAGNAMRALLGLPEDETDWVGDAIWDGDADIDRMLKMLEVEVEPEISK